MRGIEGAQDHALALPSFPDFNSAVRFFSKVRESNLGILESWSERDSELRLDYTPQSLKRIERRYFSLLEGNAFQILGTDQSTFEMCMAVYFCEVVLRANPGAEWVVQEFAFAKGKYEWGVRKDLFTMMLGLRFRNLKQIPGNKKREHIFRMYKKYFDRS